MVFSERFMDSYPYEMSQMPYGHHPYHPCSGSSPQMKVEQSRGCYGYPSQCHHGCGDDDYFAGLGAKAAYPHCAQQSAPFGHHGVYPRYDAACRVPHGPERYEYGPRNYGCLGSGCCSHSLGCGKKNFKAGEMMPGADEKIDEVKCYPHATMPFPNGYSMKMDEVPCKKRSPNQFDAGRTRPFPMSLEKEQEKSDMRNRNDIDDMQEYAEAWPWLHGYDPLTRRMNSNRRSKSPNASDINRTYDGKASRQPFAHPAERTNEAHPSKKVRTIEVKDVSKADQNNGTDSAQIGVKKSGGVLDVKLKKTYSDEEAAMLIQSVYRGYEVRRFDLLDKLKKIANICEQAAGVEGQIQSLLASSPPVDERQRRVLEESIMSLLLKLDGVQGLPPQFRETRKSAARELTKMQERLDSLIMQKSEEAKHEEMSEPLEQCAEIKSEELKDGEDNEGTEAECGNEICEDAHLEQLIDPDKSETAIPDPATESLCAFMEKENHVEDLREDEGTDSEKVAMDVELEMNPVVEFEVNLEAEHEVNPNVKLDENLNHEPVKGREVEQPENDGQPEVEDAGLTSPESVTLDSGKTDETQLKSGGSEMKSQIEGEILVGTLSSTTAASENEMGGNDPETQIDGEGLVVTLPSPEPMLPETEMPDGAQMEFDVVEPDTRDGGEVLDGTLSCPAAVEQDEVVGVTIEGHEKIVKENEELRKLTEKLVEVTKEQSAVISDLNKRVDNLERSLLAKQKLMKNKRNKKR